MFKLIGLLCIIFVVLTFTPIYDKYLDVCARMMGASENTLQRWTLGNRVFFTAIGIFLLTFENVMALF